MSTFHFRQCQVSMACCRALYSYLHLSRYEFDIEVSVVIIESNGQEKVRHLSKNLLELLRAQCIDTFDCIPQFTQCVRSVFSSQCCSAYLGRVVIVECSHLLIVSLRDGTTDFMWQEHFHFPQVKHAGVWDGKRYKNNKNRAYCQNKQIILIERGGINTTVCPSKDSADHALFTCMELLPCKCLPLMMIR